MSDYIYYNGELYHADKVKHKYIAKVRTSKGKYRYFYTKESYEAYKKGKTEKEKPKSNSVSKFFADMFNKVKKLFKKPKKQIAKTIEKGKRFVEEVILGIKKDNKNQSEKDHKYITRVKLPNGKYRYFYKIDEYNRYIARQNYQNNEPKFMKDIPKISGNKVYTAEEDMEKINPSYSKYDKATSQNCANCTAAYELRCRGYDVEAAEYENKGEYFLNGTDYRFDYYYKNAKSVTLDSNGDNHKSILNGSRWQKKFDYSPSTVESSIVKHSGVGTRGDISVSWKQGGGHSMAYEVNKDGSVVIRDCQTNRVYSVNDIASLVNNITITRTDNLELRKGILNAVKEGK